MKRIATLVALVIATLGSAIAAPPSAILVPAEQASLLRAANELRTAIQQEDTSEILRLVSRSGLTCTDDILSHNEVAADLHKKTGFLHRSLFDSKGFAQECAASYGAHWPPISDNDFFTEKDQAVDVVATSDNAARVIFRSRIATHAPREWDFEKQAGNWKLVSGFIVGGCTCGWLAELFVHAFGCKNLRGNDECIPSQESYSPQ